jgi:1,4-dihydroxy-2-naphthoate octaprenyltransferase
MSTVTSEWRLIRSSESFSIVPVVLGVAAAVAATAVTLPTWVALWMLLALLIVPPAADLVRGRFDIFEVRNVVIGLLFYFALAA